MAIISFISLKNTPIDEIKKAIPNNVIYKTNETGMIPKNVIGISPYAIKKYIKTPSIHIKYVGMVARTIFTGSISRGNTTCLTSCACPMINPRNKT